MQNECLVCHRIQAKIVFKYAHMIFKDLDRETIHQIGVEALKIINTVDQKDRIFFCGRSHSQILSGLFYLLGIKYNSRVTQQTIADAFPSQKSLTGSIMPSTVRSSYQNWLRRHPEFFKEIILKLIEMRMIPKSGKV